MATNRPWTVTESPGSEKKEVVFTIKGSSKFIADLVGSDDPGLQERGWLSVAEQRANAELIVSRVNN